MIVYIQCSEGAFAELDVELDETISEVKWKIMQSFSSCSHFKQAGWRTVPSFWLYYKKGVSAHYLTTTSSQER